MKAKNLLVAWMGTVGLVGSLAGMLPQSAEAQAWAVYPYYGASWNFGGTSWVQPGTTLIYNYAAPSYDTSSPGSSAGWTTLQRTMMQQRNQDWRLHQQALQQAQQQVQQVVQRSVTEYVSPSNGTSTSRSASSQAVVQRSVTEYVSWAPQIRTSSGPQRSAASTARNIIRWPTVLQEACFSSERAKVESPYGRIPVAVTSPTLADYRTMNGTVEEMKVVLEWRLKKGVATADYEAAKSFLNRMGVEVVAQIQRIEKDKTYETLLAAAGSEAR